MHTRSFFLQSEQTCSSSLFSRARMRFTAGALSCQKAVSFARDADSLSPRTHTHIYSQRVCSLFTQMAVRRHGITRARAPQKWNRTPIANSTRAVRTWLYFYTYETYWCERDNAMPLAAADACCTADNNASVSLISLHPICAAAVCFCFCTPTRQFSVLRELLGITLACVINTDCCIPLSLSRLLFHLLLTRAR